MLSGTHSMPGLRNECTSVYSMFIVSCVLRVCRCFFYLSDFIALCVLHAQFLSMIIFFPDISPTVNNIPDMFQIPWHFQVFQTSGHHVCSINVMIFWRKKCN